jgi:hypothetical protein
MAVIVVFLPLSNPKRILSVVSKFVPLVRQFTNFCRHSHSGNAYSLLLIIIQATGVGVMEDTSEA